MPPEPPGKRDAIVAQRLGCFCSDQGLGAPALSTEVVEAFVSVGLVGRASSTRGTYRSVLRALGGLPRRVVAPGFAGAPAAAPYSRAERAELLSVARSQRSAWRRDGALAMVALGIGAGLRAGELAAVTGLDVTVAPGAVTVRVAGAANGHGDRLVVVGRAYGQVISRLATSAGAEHLFCPGPAQRSYRNFVNNFARTLDAAPGAPRLSSGRCRSSFICDHLARGTGLAELVHLAGLAQVESLARYARHVPHAPQSKAALRARWAAC